MHLGACSCADKPEAAQRLKYKQKHFFGHNAKAAAHAREARTSSFLFLWGNKLKFKAPLEKFPRAALHSASKHSCMVSNCP